MKVISNTKYLLKLLIKRLNQKTLDSSNNPIPLSWGDGGENRNKIPKEIWFFWHDATLPFSVQTSLDTIRKFCLGYNINVLNFDNLSAYGIDVKSLKDKIKVQAITDYIRLYLISNYGGIWIDATTYFTAPIDEVFDFASCCDFYGFYTDMLTTNMAYPIVESYFLAAPKGSPFIVDWLNEFNKCISSHDPYSYYENFYSDKLFLQNMSNPSYLIVYVSAMIVMRRSCNYKLQLFKAGDTSHCYTYAFFYGKMNVYETFFLNKVPKTLPNIIKITSERRREIDKYHETGLYKLNSLIFKLNSSENNRFINRISRLVNFIFK